MHTFTVNHHLLTWALLLYFMKLRVHSSRIRIGVCTVGWFWLSMEISYWQKYSITLEFLKEVVFTKASIRQEIMTLLLIQHWIILQTLIKSDSKKCCQYQIIVHMTNWRWRVKLISNCYFLNILLIDTLWFLNNDVLNFQNDNL